MAVSEYFIKEKKKNYDHTGLSKLYLLFTYNDR